MHTLLTLKQTLSIREFPQIRDMPNLVVGFGVAEMLFGILIVPVSEENDQISLCEHLLRRRFGHVLEKRDQAMSLDESHRYPRDRPIYGIMLLRFRPTGGNDQFGELFRFEIAFRQSAPVDIPCTDKMDVHKNILP